MKLPLRENRSRPGFTLIELLVVIAMAKAKQKGQGIMCMNNHRQLAMAWRLYSEDNNDKLIGAANWTRPGETSETPNWTGGSWLTKNNPRDPNNWDHDTYTKRSKLWPYCGNTLGIWKCPADKTTGIDRQNQRVPRIRSMSMNNWVGGPGWDNSGPWFPRSTAPSAWVVFNKMSEFNDPGPSSTFVFLDEREDSINDGYFVVDMAGYPNNGNAFRIVDYPASYHNRAGGLSFADGHSEIRRWVDPRTYPTIRGNDMQLNVPSANNQDVKWMQERSTRRRG
jgi:hypothetical protein